MYIPVSYRYKEELHEYKQCGIRQLLTECKFYCKKYMHCVKSEFKRCQKLRCQKDNECIDFLNTE